MATFYVLPPRPLVKALLANQLQNVLPGLPWNEQESQQLIELLSATLLGRSDVFLVFREDLAAGEPTAQALADGFGAEPGDVVIELRPGAKPAQVQSTQWGLPEAA